MFVKLASVLLALCIVFAPLSAHAAGPTKESCASANEDGDVLRRRGALRAARISLQACAVDACPKIVRDDCVKQLAAVDAAQPSIVFAAKERGVPVTSVSVSIDGAPFLESLDGTAQPLDPGEHVFRFSLAGYPVQTLTLTIKEGDKERSETVAFGGEPPPPPPKEGRLVVTAEKGSRITIDGGAIAAERFEGALSAGRHEVRVTKAGKVDSVRTVEVQAGETQSLTVSLQEAKKPFPLPLVIAGAAIVAAGLVVGGYFVFSD